MNKEEGVEPMNEKYGDLDPFRYMVRRLIEIDSPTMIENGSPAHAQILLEEMFAHAKHTAYVYCGKISNEVWGCEAVAHAVRDAINRPGMQVRFIVQHPESIPADSAVRKVLTDHGAVVATSPRFLNVDHHFAVFDGKMYRFENNDENKTATACVNDTTTAGQLTELAQAMLRVA